MDVNFEMGETVITIKEKDLGVKKIADMNVSEQCGIATLNSNKILGIKQIHGRCETETIHSDLKMAFNNNVVIKRLS